MTTTTTEKTLSEKVHHLSLFPFQRSSRVYFVDVLFLFWPPLPRRRSQEEEEEEEEEENAGEREREVKKEEKKFVFFA